MTTPTQFELFMVAEVSNRISKASTSDIPVAGDLAVFTGNALAAEAKSVAELDLVLTTDLGTAAFAATGDFDPAGAAATALSDANNYTDAAVTRVWRDQGNYQVDSGPDWPTSTNTVGEVPILAGFLWVVANADPGGTTLTGGVVVNNGDTIRALVDAAGQTAVDWGVNESNLGYTPENQSNKVSDLSVPSAVTFPNTNAVIGGLATKMDLVASYVNGGVYLVGGGMEYLGRLYIANVAHTSSTATPDFTKFHPADGLMVEAIATGTYAPPVNANIQEYAVLVSGNITYTTGLIGNTPITFINTTATAVSVTGNPSALVEGAFTNGLSLDPGEQATVRGLVFARTGQTANAGRFKLRQTGTNGWHASFNLAALAGNRSITVPNFDVNLGLIGSVPAYANTTVYAVDNEVSYLGASYLCNIAHTSSTATPDFTKFYPVSGVLEVVTSATTFTVPNNTNIKLVRLQVTGATMAISGLNSSTQDGKVEISNALQASTCTVTCTGITTFREQNDTGASTATALVLGGLESAYITCIANSANAYWRKTTTNSFLAENTRLRKTGAPTVYSTFNAAALAAVRTINLPNVDTTMATSKYVTLTASATNQTLAIGGRYAIPIGYSGVLNIVLPTGVDGDTIEIADPYNVQRTLTGGNGVYVTPQVGQYIQYSTTTFIDIVGDLRSALAVLLTYSATNTRWELSHISRNVPMDNTDNQEYYQNGALVRRKGCLYVPAAAFLQSGGGFVGTEWVSLGVHKEAISANKTLIINSSYYMRSASPSTPYTLTLPEPYTSISNSFDGAIIEIDCLEYAGVLTLNASGWTNAAANGATNSYRQGPDYETDLSTGWRTIQCAKGMKIRFRKVQIGTVHYWFIDLGRPSDSAFSIADSTDSTKLMGFNASAIQAGERRVVTMPNADVDLGNVPNVIVPGSGNSLAGTNNTIIACSSVAMDGTDNLAIKCSGINISASQKDAIFEGVKSTMSPTITFLTPRGSKITGFRNDTGSGKGLVVESHFRTIIPTGGAGITLQDGDGVQPYFTMNTGISPTYFDIASHEIQIFAGVGPSICRRLVQARRGYGATVLEDGTETSPTFVITPTESGERLSLNIVQSPGYTGTQFTIEVFIRSRYVFA